MITWLQEPWPWYVSGPLIGLMVPLLLLAGNKHFGMSSSFRHLCAAALPLKARYFQYDWKAQVWSLALVLGVILGAAIATGALNGNAMPPVSEHARDMFVAWGIQDQSALLPGELFAPGQLRSLPVLGLLLVGGFLVGFGTRYADGCTSGHAIMGLSLLNLGSLVATVGFFAGGLLVSHAVLPWLLKAIL